MMITPAVEEMVRQWLEANGFDGLVLTSEECGCDSDSLFPCSEPAPGHCQAAYRWSDGLMYTEPEIRISEAARRVAEVEAENTLLRAEAGIVKEAIDLECECGGSGPDDLDACAACRVWHRMKK